MKRRGLGAQAASFVLIGGIGFVIDATVLTVLSVHLHINVFLSRIVSFALASLATWLLNRRHTFGFHQAAATTVGGEYVRYMSVQITGALINLGVFSALIALQPALLHLPVLPLAAGSIVAMVTNFCGARFWVYRR